jgi:hypothetical protein
MPSSLTRRAFVVGAPLALAACSAESVWAPEAVVNAAVYRSGGPSALTLFTVKNTRTGNGAHTALLVDASQRVLFDPAGSFQADVVPERNDVLFGFSPQAEQAYISYHSRTDYFVIVQNVIVQAEVAETALRLSIANGAVRKANCTRATSAILGQLPGFASIGSTWFPNNLSASFEEFPGVQSREVRERD